MLQVLLLVALVGLITGSIRMAQHEYVDWVPSRALAFSPDGTTLAVGAVWKSAERFALCDVGTGEPRAILDLGGRIEQVVFSPNGQWLVALVTNVRRSVLWVVDSATGQASTRLLTGPGRAKGGRMAFTPDGSQLVALEGESIATWSVASWKVDTVRAHAEVTLDQPLTFAALSARGDLIAGRTRRSEVALVAARNGKTLGELRIRPVPKTVIFSPDGALLLASTPTPAGLMVQAYDVATRKKLYERELPPGEFCCSSDSACVVVVVSTGTDPLQSAVIAFDARTGARVAPPVQATLPGEVGSLALSPGDSCVAFGWTDQGVALVDVTTKAVTPIDLANDETRPASLFAFFATIWLILWELATRDWSAISWRGAGKGFYVGVCFALVAFGSSLGYLGTPSGVPIDRNAFLIRFFILSAVSFLCGFPLALRQIRRDAGPRRLLGWVGAAGSISVFPIGLVMHHVALEM